MATLLLWPMLRHFGSHYLAAPDDSSIFIWAYWALPEEVARLSDPYVTNLLFYPVGVDLSFNTDTPIVAFLVWPLTRTIGLGPTANLLQLVAVMVSSLGAYHLALYVTGDRWASFFAGCAFTWLPYRFYHALGHFNLIHTGLIAFGTLALLVFYREPSRRQAVIVGLLSGVTFLVDGSLFIFLLIVAGLLAIWYHRSLRSSRFRRHGLEAGAVAALVSLPLLLPMIRAILRGDSDPADGLGGAEQFSADLLSWVTPPPWNPVLGSTLGQAWATISGGREGMAYPGLLVLALAAVGAIVGKGRRGPWILIAVVGALLSLGPYLHVNGHTGDLFSYLGHDFAVPLPYLVVHKVPVLSSLRVPGRVAIVAVLALDVLAALALARVRVRLPRLGTLAVVAALAVTLVEFWPPHRPLQPARVPEPYHAIAAHPDPGAVLEVPLQWKTGLEVYGDQGGRHRDHSIFMYYATVHERPIAGGFVARYPERRFEELFAIATYRQLMALQGDPRFTDPPTFTTADLRSLGFGFVVFHRDRASEPAYSYLAGLDMPVLADDGTVVVWTVP